MFVNDQQHNSNIVFTSRHLSSISLDETIPHGHTKGLCTERKNSKKTRLLWKWVGGSRSHSEFVFFGKSSQNSPKPVLIFWSNIPCEFCLYIAKSCWLLLLLYIIVSYIQLSLLEPCSGQWPNFEEASFGWWSM